MSASPAPASPAPASRAGRNLPMAIGVGLFLGAIIVASLLLWRQGFLIIIAAAVGASIWEMRSTLATARGIRLAWLPLAVGAVATVVCAWPWGHQAQAVGIAVTALVLLAWRFTGGADGYLADVSASVFLLVYLGGFASFAAMMVAPEDGAARVLTFLIAVVCSDTGGYAAGVLFGKHPMAPRISPKKSWEGFAGSVVTAGVGGSLSVWLLLDHPWWQGLVLGLVLALVATIGDLAESLIKRDLGVKDMGTLLPGHGGVMDRMDSLLPSAVVAWILLSVFVPLP
ncbi:phosphatidate cytidylyltransferase [Nakamurella sp. YIM 132087]|uniref:Phosphatidate cytidylyltransferase n=1 Tax=Nakamurella alba TaxID=2665158 RepID=A0A7K1FRE0_9ACTN|nr:phosphatidate cytidylyltransferase [Nakamurella alba]